MTIEIELDLNDPITSGDCIEICGIIGKSIFQVIFLSNGKPKFKFSMDQRYGWDVCMWGETKCDIQSGSNCSYLDYYSNKQFTLCFHIKSNQILTLLNDNLMSTTEILSPIEEINSIKVSGDNSMKYIAFADCTHNSSRIIQPAIYKSLESKGNHDITVIESRKRVVFTSKNAENMPCFSESEDESDDEIFFKNDIKSDFNYFNKILFGCTLSKAEDFFYKYPNALPDNRYVINYFTPTESISDPEESVVEHKKSNIEIQLIEIENESSMTDDEKFVELRLQLEKIRKHLEKTGFEIDRFKSLPSLNSVKEESHSKLERKVSRILQIPVLKDGSMVKWKISNINGKFPKNTKIPVLLKKPSQTDDVILNENESVDTVSDLPKKRKCKSMSNRGKILIKRI